MGNHKLCFLNSGSLHYRKNIWMLMDQELNCDFYFGDNRRDNIKPIDTNLLKNFKGYFHNVFFGGFFWQKGALRLLNNGYTDIILQGDVYSLTVWALLLFGKLKKKSVYLWTHGAYGDENWIKRKIFIRMYTLAKGTFLYGDYARQILVRWGVPEGKLHLIFNSLDYDQQLPLRDNMIQSPLYQNHFGNNHSNLVFIGRLTKVKKLHQVLEAIALLKRQGKDYNITFVGDGEEKQRLELMADELDIKNNVWLYGACYDERRIAELLFNADLCVSPGNVGLTAMHAMTFGCPVLSHNNFAAQMPEFEAIEEGATGAFFKENDIKSLAEAIDNWQSNQKNREEIRKECYRVIDEKYNPHVQVDTLRTVIFK